MSNFQIDIDSRPRRLWSLWEVNAGREVNMGDKAHFFPVSEHLEIEEVYT